MFESDYYRKSPIWLQEQLIAARAIVRRVLREERSFRKLLADAERTQWMKRSEIDLLILKRLQQLLSHAGRNVPYYRETFAKVGFNPASMKSTEAVRRIPVLTKAQAIEFGHRLVDETHRGVKIIDTTSGTTGTPLKIVSDLRAIRFEAAMAWRQLQWAGYIRGQKRIWLRGDPIVPFKQTEPPYWRFNSTENMLMMSSYHLTEQSVDAYIQALQKFDPVLIQAYPSSITFLARFLEGADRHYKGNNLKGIVTSSEPLTQEQRRLVRTRFRCKMFDYYGSYEHVAEVGTCEYGNYHVFEDHSFVEFEPQGDGSCEIIGTGFGNLCMPLLRYRSFDSVVLADPNYKCPCGKAFRVVERINGRLDDVIKTSDGRLHVMPDFIFHGMHTVMEAQFVQDKVDEVRIVVVPRDGFSEQDENLLLGRARERFGPAMTVRLEQVSSIPRTPTGKFRGVICRI